MPDNLTLSIIICFIAGLGAGLGTGFAGLSAATIITPLLVAFLHISFNQAVAIALASDVLASLIAAIMYGRKKNIDFKNAIIMMVFVLAFTVLGSFISYFVQSAVDNNDTMNIFPVVGALIIGIRFIVKPVTATKESMETISKKKRIIGAIVSGSLIGLVAGFAGAGGGMMLLFALTMVLGYELKTAVGTSVLIMSLTAFTGAISHFIINIVNTNEPVHYFELILCCVFTFLFAQIGSYIANKSSNKVLNRITGTILITSSLVVLFASYLWPQIHKKEHRSESTPIVEVMTVECGGMYEEG